ncbi:MAG: hypothetical protein BroJett011_04030 [Chloroflexota bacterium]|nr:MAG: hypothetical protein BroJett011_04030 [Chloroflexota bacterium]
MEALRRHSRPQQITVGGETRTIPANEGMVRQLAERLGESHPDYVDLCDLLRLAKTTWRLYGIGAAELSEMDEETLAHVRLAAGL